MYSLGNGRNEFVKNAGWQATSLPASPIWFATSPVDSYVVAQSVPYSDRPLVLTLSRLAGTRSYNLKVSGVRLKSESR